MRYLFFVLPSAGEINPTLAVAQALLEQDDKAEIYLATGASITSLLAKSPLVDRIKTIILDDRTHLVFDTIDWSHHLVPHARGNPIPFLERLESLDFNKLDGMVAVAQSSRRAVQEIKPDLIIVNGHSSCAFDGMLSVFGTYLKTADFV